jgi:hypothetical protein
VSDLISRLHAIEGRLSQRDRATINEAISLINALPVSKSENEGQSEYYMALSKLADEGPKAFNYYSGLHWSKLDLG